MISAQTIARGLFSLLESGIAYDKVVKAFQRYVQKYHLEASVPSIIHYLDFFNRQKIQNHGVDIIVAHDISTEVVNDIKTFINADNTAAIDIKIDESLIGGFIARYKNIEHDASLATQLSRLQHSIIHNHS